MTYHLYYWAVCQSIDIYGVPERKLDDPYYLPPSKYYRLRGQKDDDTRFIVTSYIVSMEGNVVQTRSGNTYILEDIDPVYETWLEERQKK